MTESNPPDGPAARPEKVRIPGLALFVALVVIAAVAMMVVLPAEWWSGGSRALEHPAVGRKLPRLDLQPLTGQVQPVTLDALSGQVVLLNFWGTWCPPCLAELPDMAEVERTFRAREDFRFLAVSCGQDIGAEDLETLRAQTSRLLAAQQIDMPTYADPGGTTRLAVDQVVGLEVIPTTLVLDPQGTIRAVWEGVATEKELETLIRRLLEE